MGTHYYSLPTVDPDSTLSFPDAVNGLGNSTDAVLHGIQEGFKGNDYHLPTASADTLGGVRIGKGFKAYSDGLLTTSQERFKLKPATADTLGGVYIGKNVTVDAEGRIGVGAGAFGSIDVGTAQLEDKAVTTEKFADASVSEGKTSPVVVSTLQSPAAIWKNARTYPIKVKIDSVHELSFVLHRVSSKVAFICFTDVDTLYDMAALKGKTGELYKDSSNKYAPGELGTGLINVAGCTLEKSSAHYFTDGFYSGVTFDLTNATAKLWESNQSFNYQSRGAFKVFPGYQLEV